MKQLRKDPQNIQAAHTTQYQKNTQLKRGKKT